MNQETALLGSKCNTTCSKVIKRLQLGCRKPKLRARRTGWGRVSNPSPPAGFKPAPTDRFAIHHPFPQMAGGARPADSMLASIFARNTKACALWLNR